MEHESPLIYSLHSIMSQFTVHINFIVKINFNIITRSTLRSQKFYVLFEYLTKILYASPISPTHATCPAYHTLLDLTTQIIAVKVYKS
jgi:hypothetical protein